MSRAEEHNIKGNEAFNAEDYEQAYKLYSKAIKRADPPLAKYYTNRARACIRLKRYDLAFEDADQALRLDPENYKALYCKGEVFFAKHDYALAQKQFEAALRISPNDSAIRLKIDECKRSNFNKSVLNDETNDIFKAHSKKDVQNLLSAISRGEVPEQLRGIKEQDSDFDYAAADKEMKMISKTSPIVIEAHDYRDGTRGKKRNYQKAIELYSKAASMENTEAMYNLALMYSQGRGVPIDFEAARQQHKKATSYPLFMSVPGRIPRLGVALAHNSLGIHYSEGLGVKRDLKKAFEHFKHSAEGGETSGMNNVGLAYFRGSGTPMDELKAIEWYTKAAEKNWPVSQYNLGRIYLEGLPHVGVEKNIALAREMLEKAAEQGYSEASIELSKLDNSAISTLEKAAETGSPQAMHNLAVAYAEGIDIITPNLELALQWFNKAAKKNFPESQFRLGDLYLHEVPNSIEPKRIEKGVRWIRRAAQLDHPQSQFMLSELYLYGDYGVKRDVSEAKIWRNRAIENGISMLGGKFFESSDKNDFSGKNNGEFEELLSKIGEWELSEKLDSDDITNKDRLNRYSLARKISKSFADPKQAQEFAEADKKLSESMAEGFRRGTTASLPQDRIRMFPMEELVLYANTRVGDRLIAAKQHHMLSIKLFVEGDCKGYIHEWFEAYKLCDIICFLPEDLRPRVLNTIEKFVKENPEDSKSKFTLATLYTMMKKPHSVVISLFDECIRLNNQEPTFYIFRGSTKSFARLYSSAILDFDEALRIVDQEEKYHVYYVRAATYRLGCTETEIGIWHPDMKAALNDYENYLKLAPPYERKLPEAYYSMAYLYMVVDDIEKATDFYKHGLDAEASRLPIFAPIDFPLKDSIGSILKMRTLFKNMPSKVRVCPVCQMEAKKVCSRCKKVWYCTQEHQKEDWKKHKISCRADKQIEAP